MREDDLIPAHKRASSECNTRTWCGHPPTHRPSPGRSRTTNVNCVHHAFRVRLIGIRYKQRRQHFSLKTSKDLTDRLATSVRGGGARFASDTLLGRTLPSAPTALSLAGRGKGEVGGGPEPPAPVVFGVRGGAGGDGESEEEGELSEISTVSFYA